MQNTDQSEIFADGQDFGRALRGKAWPEEAEVPLAWMHQAAKYLEENTRYQRINLRAEALKFAGYWSNKTGKGARKVNWKRTWMNWCVTAAQRAGYREREDAQLSRDGHYQDDSDYGIGYRA